MNAFFVQKKRLDFQDVLDVSFNLLSFIILDPLLLKQRLLHYQYIVQSF